MRESRQLEDCDHVVQYWIGHLVACGGRLRKEKEREIMKKSRRGTRNPRKLLTSNSKCIRMSSPPRRGVAKGLMISTLGPAHRTPRGCGQWVRFVGVVSGGLTNREDNSCNGRRTGIFSDRHDHLDLMQQAHVRVSVIVCE